MASKLAVVGGALGSGGAAALDENATTAGAWRGGGGTTWCAPRRLTLEPRSRKGSWRGGEQSSAGTIGTWRGAAVGFVGRWEIGFVVFFIGLLVFWAAVIWAQCVRCVVSMFLG
jgi:hypothetical protein